MLLDVPLLPGHQAHNQERSVFFVPKPDDSQQSIGDALIQIRKKPLLYLADIVIGVLDRRPPRGAGGHDNHATVFRGRQFLGQLRIYHHRNHQSDHAKTQQQSGLVQGKLQQPSITVGKPIQGFFTGGP